MSNTERHVMIDLVGSYVRHITKCKRSLIAKIYGVFSISINDWDPFYVVLLENLDPFPTDHIYFKYDRKFSKKNRFYLKTKTSVAKYK